ncbi:glucose-6-phosphate dehydrogenase assembly protein OpcA [Pelagicoccus sp. NFK12]|uniref:Glucose-6-phosphate dehydrogenase assembly protein OpcA n=1 Tax=Pelagicoccus enzymogenes TaxID=2773457 RepID=A0A927F587_9BACT|nr:glucose-6-phosphate dehydrogenase assembly protein OpcA [Pelagicoccus enzymogenes]MBD5778613.1 glucose-6-phosphate dehydrogenase assembly protein OpcA [Pelagicoccus enzymogenes]MDQ8197015.1 glucose-6-phosphate dehydrogenase assembly protein OpcA [Pelagicoccus enzymogenes]
MSKTSTVYEALPGLSVPLGSALKELTAMWSPVDESGKRKDNEYRASRMNLIVHIGFEASLDEAKELFQTVISFSHKYPCRMIVLCPQPDSWESEKDMGCKIFSECVFGEGAGGMSCCEVLILGYTLSDRQYLENQTSVFLEADLPTYYWPTRFGSAELLSDYKFFFKQAERVIFDSSRECFLIDQVDVPQPEKVHDLAYSRLLPIRQSVGQFLSAFPKEAIVDGLAEVSLSSSPSFKCEGRALMSWVASALTKCYPSPEEAKKALRFEQQEAGDDDAMPIMSFVYSNDNYVTFTIDLAKSEAHVEGDLGNGKQSLTTGVRLLDPETALAEALFHG